MTRQPDGTWAIDSFFDITYRIDFVGHPNLVPLLLPDQFVGHPLRKDFVLAARAAKPWPGAKEPGESEHGAPSRRKTQKEAAHG